MLEKLCGLIFGDGFSCFDDKSVSAVAVKRPMIVTSRALSFSRGVIVITWVFVGRKLDVINRPAIILPQARRLIGLITVGLFSLIGDSGVDRGCPINAKKITRKL